MKARLNPSVAKGRVPPDAVLLLQTFVIESKAAHVQDSSSSLGTKLTMTGFHRADMRMPGRVFS